MKVFERFILIFGRREIRNRKIYKLFQKRSRKTFNLISELSYTQILLRFLNIAISLEENKKQRIRKEKE